MNCKTPKMQSRCLSHVYLNASFSAGEQMSLVPVSHLACIVDAHHAWLVTLLTCIYPTCSVTCSATSSVAQTGVAILRLAVQAACLLFPGLLSGAFCLLQPILRNNPNHRIADYAPHVMQVKVAMIDDAQASIASLKTQLNAAQAEASETAAALQHAEADLSEHEADSQRQQQSLRYSTRTIWPHYAKLCLPSNRLGAFNCRAV